MGLENRGTDDGGAIIFAVLGCGLNLLGTYVVFAVTGWGIICVWFLGFICTLVSLRFTVTKSARIAVSALAVISMASIILPFAVKGIDGTMKELSFD